MPNQRENPERRFDQSSLRNRTVDPAADTDDVATEDALDRLEAITGGAEEPVFAEGKMDREINKLDASTEEEIDALKLNQADNDPGRSRDSSGRIADDLAAEHIAGFTEVGRELPDKGVRSVVPGRDDTSRELRRHHPNTEIARAQDVVEGNLEEPRELGVSDRKVDEGTAA